MRSRMSFRLWLYVLIVLTLANTAFGAWRGHWWSWVAAGTCAASAAYCTWVRFKLKAGA